jgi:hypothetical protein
LAKVNGKSERVKVKLRNVDVTAKENVLSRGLEST